MRTNIANDNSLIYDTIIALAWNQNFISDPYLGNELIEFDQIMFMHWYWQDADLDCQLKI